MTGIPIFGINAVDHEGFQQVRKGAERPQPRGASLGDVIINKRNTFQDFIDHGDDDVEFFKEVTSKMKSRIKLADHEGQ